MLINLGIFFILVVNLLSFSLIWYDKAKSKTGGWRISENRFLLLALIGGAIGIYIGMETFRHKTKHAIFKYGIPLLIFLNLIVFSSILHRLV